MRFYLGEVYETSSPAGTRQAVVVEIKDGGRQGKLRFVDTEEEHAFVWGDLHRTAEWRRSERE